MNELEEFDKLCEKERKNAKNPCAWCDLEKDSGAKDKPVSHGICDFHSNELLISMYEGLASEWGYMI